jgi:hypothetical protein
VLPWAVEIESESPSMELFAVAEGWEFLENVLAVFADDLLLVELGAVVAVVGAVERVVVQVEFEGQLRSA